MPDADRGQLLIIGAVAMAMVLVGFGVVLNAVLYADAQAAQEEATTGGDPVRFHQSAHAGVGGGIFYANYDDHGSYDRLVERVRNATRTWTANASAHYTVNGVLVGSRTRSFTNGTQVTQSSKRSLTTVDGEADWTVAPDVTGVRRFSLNVSRGSLEQPTVDPTLTDLISQGVTRIRASNGTAERTVYLYRNGSDYVIVQTAHDGNSLGTCSVKAPHPTVDLTEGTVGGRDCPSLGFPGLTGTYDVEIENGDNATARYALVVDRGLSAVDDGDFGSGGGGCGGGSTDPLATRAVYSSTVNVSYVSDQRTYRTDVTVAPESTPRGRAYGVETLGSGPGEVVYTNASAGLFSITPSGNVTEYPVTDAQVIGPKVADLDGDGLCEIPYVNSSNTLNVVDENGNVEALAESAVKSKTRLGVGTWDGSQDVFYVNNSDGKLYRVSPGESPTVALAADGDGDGISAVGGIADYNDDGDTDIVFVDGSQLVTYLDDGLTHEASEGVGLNNGVGIGRPKDFDGDGKTRAPIVSGSNNIRLLPHSSSSEALTGSGPATKAPVVGIDWTGNADKEVVFVKDSHLYYVTLSGSINQVEDSSGNHVAADGQRGAA